MNLSKIQIRLTISYLFNASMIIGMFLLLTFGGYFLYLKTDIAAYWAGEQAKLGVDELMFWLEEDELDAIIAQDFVFAYYSDLEYEDDNQIVTVTTGEMALVIDVNGVVIASSHLDVVPLNTSVFDKTVAGVSLNVIQNRQARTVYQNLGQHHVGQAPIVNSQGDLLGWFYYKSEADDISDLMQNIAITLALPFLITAFLAFIISGLFGLLFARSFTKQIRVIQMASRNFANGQFEKRIPITGSDEFTELSLQFNRMAEQIQKQMQDLNTLAETNASLAKEARQLSAMEERKHLAHELHDSVKQQLFGLNLMLGSIKTTSKPDADAFINQMIAQVQDIQNELDHIIKALRPASLQGAGLVDALQALTSRWATQTNVKVNVQVHAEREVSVHIEEGIYRITQEALQNIMKHAQATHVDVSLTFMKTEIILTISDNGKGFDEKLAQHRDRLGLSSMQARAHAIQAELLIESQIGKGTTLVLKIPMKENE
jgi:two-component system, NarL family, sensor histidine kinase LiaS